MTAMSPRFAPVTLIGVPGSPLEGITPDMVGVADDEYLQPYAQVQEGGLIDAGDIQDAGDVHQGGRLGRCR